ncbi:oligosaccharide flippase family protein [Mariniphaga anaerophila]|nr:oligosaccharide flippase family protein [Mariniphaga anaerophila]
MPGIRNSIKNLIKSDFYRDILKLFSGMFFARLFPALFALIIVRIYTPENFGIFVLYLTIASAISIVATGKYESALFLAESPDERKHIFWLSQKINTAVNLVALAVLLLYILIFRISDFGRIIMLLLIPFYSFSLGAVQLIRNILIARKSFKTLSILEVIRAVITGILQCALFVFPVLGLFLGAVCSQLFIYVWYSQRLPESSGFKPVRFSTKEKELARRYINFPKYSVASEFFNFISSQLPVFMVKPFFGETMLGLYSFSHRYISVPIQLVSISISRVYIQKAQSLKNNLNELSALTFSLFKKQFWMGIFPFTILGLWGAEIFGVLFGSEWEFSGYLAQLLSPWLFLVMLSSPLSSVLIIFEKQKFSMNYNIILLVTRIVSLAIGGFVFHDIVWAIGLYSLTGFVFFAALGAWSMKLAGVKIADMALFVAKATVITVFPLILIKLWVLN